MTHTAPLSAEREALKMILDRLMSEETSIDTLCKHLPRIVSVAANVARIQSVLESASRPDETDEILKALAELAGEDDNEEDAW